jgi:rubrerythrin
VTKDELLERIDTAIRTEESASNFYAEHLSTLLLRSGLEEEAIRRLRALIDRLVAANEEHRRRLEGLAERLQEDPRDVY